ncbi:pseudouridylate synthase 7 homolog [Melanaphis sacchari]|uniref:pseudouridylate synthase 7 homolog n=1 Tax=Melanaphis sacchari TaxID=742174 RepID=UPI000DC14B76|nr:pseudouridylate synthase 7 homolog [Melanaphis sacchari]
MSTTLVDEELDRSSIAINENKDDSFQKISRPVKTVLYEGLQEKDVGITEFTTSNPGISGILKHRLSDFQVNEIALDGTVIRLTSRTVPEKEAEDPNLENVVDDTGLCDKYSKDIDELIELQSTKRILIDVDGLTKEKRKSIHNLLKFKYGSKISTNTEKDDQNKQIIVIRLSTLVKNDRQTWPKSRPEYLHFALHKCNMDTTNVVNILSKQLRVKVNTIKHAGTKDKRGNTTQMLSVRKLNANNVAKFYARNIWTGNYVYKDYTLKLGSLKGNRFRIVLRNIKGNDEEVSNAIEMLKLHGFINYYGLQRFGSSVVSPTYVVGKSLACGNCEEAIEHILKPRPLESAFENDTDRARSVWWNTRDPKLALKQLSKKNFTVEAKIIRSLAFNGPKAYVNAFQIIPRNLVLLYLHSYQSLIWNKIVSQRIQKFGLKPIVGDLVFKDNESKEVLDEVIDGEEIKEEDEEEEETDVNNVKFPEVETISEDNLSKYTIFDVVYPLPGCDVSYPKNEIGKWYIDLLAEDGLTSEKLSKKNKLFSLKGTYRSIVSKAEDLIWATINHNDLNDDLLLSDIEVMENKQPFISVPDGSFKSLSIEFSLRPSNYATMVVRQITKQDTSSHTQASLCKISNNNKRDIISTEEEDNDSKRIKIDLPTED